MNKFILLDDIFILDKKVLSKDSLIEFNQDDELLLQTDLGQIKFSKDLLQDKIKMVKEDIQVSISVIDEDEELQVKNWRLQLDFKASKRKVQEIETYLRKTLQDML